MNALLPGNAPYSGAVVAPSGLLYAAPQFGNAAAFDRSVPSGTALGIGGNHADVAFLSSGNAVSVPVEPEAPRLLSLFPARPNPMSAGTTIRFTLPQAGPVRLAVFDLAGRRVRTLIDGRLPAGDHAVDWNGRSARGAAVASGTYFVVIDAAGESRTLKITLAR